MDNLQIKLACDTILPKPLSEDAFYQRHSNEAWHKIKRVFQNARPVRANPNKAFTTWTTQQRL